MKNVFLYIFVMALTTYLVRVLPVILFRGKIKSRFVHNFFYYVPYAVLSAMTIPSVFYSAGADAASVLSAAIGFVAAVLFSFMEKSLLTVALVACTVCFAANFLIGII